MWLYIIKNILINIYEPTSSFTRKKAEKTISYSHPFTISMVIFSCITGVILMYSEEKRTRLKELAKSRSFLAAMILIVTFSIWTLNMSGDSEEVEKIKKSTKQALLGLVIAIFAYLDLKAAPFFIIWIVSYYLDI